MQSESKVGLKDLLESSNEPPDLVSKSDSGAKEENDAFKKERLQALTEQALKDRQTRRDEKTKEIVHWIFMWGLRLAGLGLAAVFLVRLWHLISPECLLWLSPERISDVDKILFSGALGAIISKYLGPILGHR